MKTIDEILDRVYLYGMNGGLGYGKFQNELSPKHAKQAILTLIEQEKKELLDRITLEFTPEGITVGLRKEKMTYVSTVNKIIEAERTSLKNITIGDTK